MSTMDHYSIDLETLDNKPTSAILSIGVQQFDPDTGKLGGNFYKEIDIDSAIRSGTVSGSKLAWWAQQTDKARRVFGKENKVALATALDELATWLRGKSIAPIVWGNGSVFDITILEHAYRNGGVGLAIPWHFTNIRDMRTIVDAADLAPTDWPARNGVHHNALDDAIYQAEVISLCWQRCRSSKRPVTLRKQKPAPVVAAPVTEDDEL